MMPQLWVRSFEGCANTDALYRAAWGLQSPAAYVGLTSAAVMEGILHVDLRQPLKPCPEPCLTSASCMSSGRENRFGPSDPNRDLLFGNRVHLKACTRRREGSKAILTQKLFCFHLRTAVFNVFTPAQHHMEWVGVGFATSQGICKVCSKSSSLPPREGSTKT